MVTRYVRDIVDSALEDEEIHGEETYVFDDCFKVIVSPYSARYKYEIVDPEALASKLLERSDYKLLSADQIKLLVQSANDGYEAYHGTEDGDRLVDRHGETVIPKKKYWAPVADLLRLLGVLSH